MSGWGRGSTFFATLFFAAAGYSQQAANPSIAPIEQYLMERDAEIALARSAAPEAISKDAEVMVLTRHGYETAAKGTNGFVCLVERGWANGFDDPDFGNTATHGAECHNAASVKTNIPIILKRAELALQGMPTVQMKAAWEAAFAKGELTAPGIGAMCYMMSKQQQLGNNGHWHPHLMFFIPLTDDMAWGANVKGSPVIAVPDKDNRMTIFMIKLGKWSDGTPAMPIDMN